MRITGKIEMNGTETEFSIDGDIGWQQWGATTEVLGDRVPILEALTAGLSDCPEWQEEDEEDAPVCPDCDEELVGEDPKYCPFCDKEEGRTA
jgi:hypothetical protein